MKKRLGFIFTSLLLLLGMTGCGDKKVELIDYVSQTKLAKSYEGKEFFKDGIGKVELDKCVDGDTAHFFSNGKQLKIRFNGIDTPESTGAIEPYGKKASDFTCKLLTDAKNKKQDIVIESNGDMPQKDSTKERYLGWVWAGGKLVNLAVVQEGFSIAKGYQDTPYEEAMYNAERQAIENKLNIWSNKKDDKFNYGDYKLTDLQQINLDPEKWIGEKVIFNAVVTRRIAANCYVQQDFTNEDGSVSAYGLYIFTQYNPNVRTFFVEGNYIKFMGIVATYNGNLQLTDVKYNPLFPSENDSVLIESGRPITTKVMTIPEIKETTFTNLLVRLENVNFVRSGSYINENGMSINVRDDQGNTLIIRSSKDNYFTDENGNRVEDISYFENKGKMTFTGNITCYEGVNQIDLSRMSDVSYAQA